MASVRIFQKKQIRLDRLNFRQNQMFQIGNVGVATVKNRLSAGLGPNDSPAKPLSKRYAIWKTKLGKGNRRNLYLSGNMLRNFMVRTVSEKQAKASNTTRKDREKAWANQQIEPWGVFSPKNIQAVVESTNRIVQEMVPRLVLERGGIAATGDRLGGRR